MGPHIVPRGTANNMPLHKIRKKVQNRPTLPYTTNSWHSFTPCTPPPPSSKDCLLPHKYFLESGLKSSAGGIRLDFFFSSQCISNLCPFPIFLLWRCASYSRPENRRPLRLSEVQQGRRNGQSRRKPASRASRMYLSPTSVPSLPL